MPEWLLWIVGVVLFIVILAISVGLHEAGHMVTAKMFKLRVPNFFVGFGPKIFSFKKKETEYGVRAIPLGGFVTIEDERYEEKSYERLTLSRVSPWKRQIIYAAGPAVNIFLGTVILLTTLTVTPYNDPSTTVAQINLCDPAVETISCGAADAGILPGDTIKSIDNTPINTFSEMSPVMIGKESVDIIVSRNGEDVALENVSLLQDTMGITVTTVPTYRTINDSTAYLGSLFEANIQAIAALPSKVPNIVESVFTGERDATSPGSIVSVGKTYGDVAAAPDPLDDKIVQFAMYTGLFNLGLGIINLVPIMPLDGGRMFVALMDSIRKVWAKIMKKVYEPTGENVLTALTGVSVIFVFGFMALIIVSDFRVIFAGNL